MLGEAKGRFGHDDLADESAEARGDVVEGQDGGEGEGEEEERAAEGRGFAAFRSQRVELTVLWRTVRLLLETCLNGRCACGE